SFSFQADRYSYTGNFPGNENTVFAAAAFKLSQSVDVGIKLEYVYGKRDVDVNEDLIVDVILLQLRESHRLSYFVPTIGIAVKLSPVWRLGAAWVHPLRGNVDRTLDQVFESNFERIVVSGLENKDSLYRPARLYLGTTLEPFANPAGKESKKTSFTIAAEAVYALWSQYKYEFYSEFLERDMRNTLVLALGMELGLLKRNGGFFARLGYRMDPQPVTRPETTLHALTGGLGIRLGQVSLDVGGMYYYGSIDDFSQQHLVFNATLQIALGK
ncbi:MAG: hypothetical protein GY940_38300, partial [bacterium]|nr:hypothetical protein [bacterium]